MVFVIHRYIYQSRRSAPSIQLFFRNIFVSELPLRFPVTLCECKLVISIPVERLPLCLVIYRAFPFEESALEGKKKIEISFFSSQKWPALCFFYTSCIR